MRILIAEDNVAQAESLSILLTRLGHRVFLAGDGNQAISQVQTHGCDAAVIDLLMPGMNGRDLIAWLRSNDGTREIPLVISTGWPLDHESLEPFLAMPLVTVLQKPFGVEELQRALGCEKEKKKQ